jgi:hypothetical protein
MNALDASLIAALWVDGHVTGIAVGIGVAAAADWLVHAVVRVLEARAP